MVRKGSTTKKSASHKSLKKSSSRSHSHASHHSTNSSGFKMFSHCPVCRCKVNINNCKYVMVKGKGSKMRTRIEGVCEKGHKFAQFAKSSGGKSLSKTMKGGAGNGRRVRRVRRVHRDGDGYMPIIEMDINEIRRAIEPTFNYATELLKFEINNEQQPDNQEEDFPLQNAYSVLVDEVSTSYKLIREQVDAIIATAIISKNDHLINNDQITTELTDAVRTIFTNANNNVYQNILIEMNIYFGNFIITVRNILIAYDNINV